MECLTGKTWDDALRERLLKPLGLNRTFTLPEEAMVYPVAVGHEPKTADTLALSPVTTWLDPRGSGPCGGTLSTTAADLLAFARMHMRDGAGPGGQRVLSAESAKAMREPQVAQPDPSMSPAWGLGWGVERAADPLVVEHGGNTCGQESQLVLVPEPDIAMCVLTNGDVQGLLRKDLLAGLLRDLTGIDRPGTPDPAPPGTALHLGPFVGGFSRSKDLRIDVTETNGALQAAFVTSGEVAEKMPPFTVPLSYATGATFLLTLPRMTVPITATFLHEDGGQVANGTATHLAVGLRVAPRVSDSGTDSRGPGAGGD